MFSVWILPPKPPASSDAGEHGRLFVEVSVGRLKTEDARTKAMQPLYEEDENLIRIMLDRCSFEATRD